MNDTISFVIFFFAIQLVNVIFNTVRLILTVKASKIVASTFTAISYGIYTIVLVYTASDFNLWIKVAVAFSSNLIGVFIGTTILEKLRRDRVWKIEAIIPIWSNISELTEKLQTQEIIYSIMKNENNIVISGYTKTQKESHNFRALLTEYKAIFVAFEQNAKP